jgi:A/G-specific adenine glycosylase
MLQQTQVSRVEVFYPAFLKRFSSIEALARARPKAVREAWEGLGYYARASHIHALARVVRRDFEGKLPENPEELERLPGVGRYTAGAIACFAYEKPVAAVDTNVARVIRRVFFGDGGRGRREGSNHRTTRPSSPLPRPGAIWDKAAAIVPRNGKRAWMFNQAMMELGATVCIARKPRCHECPVVRDCKTGRRIGRRSDV